MWGMRALIFANGEPPSTALANELANAANIIIAADGGANRALEAGIAAAVVIGDLDSVTAATRAQLPRAELIRDADPDHTDLQKAIHLAMARGATEIDVIGAGGGRADHALGNLSLLVLYGRQVAIRFVDDQFEIALVDRQATIDGAPGTVVSLLAIGTCTGLTTEGLRWPLKDYTLVFSPYGVHNEIASHPASVSVATGDLLLFKGRWVEKHG